MKLRYRLAAFLLAAGLVFSNTAVHEVCAAEVEGAAAAVTDEEKAVYEMPVESNALKNWPEGPGIFAEAGIIMDMNSGAIHHFLCVRHEMFRDILIHILVLFEEYYHFRHRLQ